MRQTPRYAPNTEPDTRVLWSVCYARSLDSWRGQRRSIDFSNGPPKTRMTRTSAAPKATIRIRKLSARANQLRPSASSSTPICRSKPPVMDTSAQKPQDGKSRNKERTASDRQFCYCPVGFSAWLIRYGGGNAAEENNGRVSDRYRQ